MSPRARATLAGFAAVLLWSTLAVLTTATAGIPPLQLLALGFGVAGLAGVGWLLRPGGPGRAALAQPPAAAVLTVAALAGYHALYFAALKLAPAVEANLVNYLWPLLIVVFAALAGGSRVRPAQWLGTGLGLAAAVLLVTRGQAPALAPQHAAGYVAALGAAVVWSLYSVLNGRFAAVPVTAMAGNCLLVALIGAGAHLVFESWTTPSPLQWLVIAAIGLGPTGIAFALWDIGTKRGDIALLGTLGYAAPLLSTAWLLAFGRGALHGSQAVAVALLLAGAWLAMRRGRRPDEPSPAAGEPGCGRRE